MDSFLSRRGFLTSAGMLVGSSALSTAFPVVAHATRFGNPPMIGASHAERPQFPSGIQFGDVTEGRAIVWARSDRNARMIVEYDTTERFRHARRVVGPYAKEETDYTTRVDLAGLPQGQTIFVRVSYIDPHSHRIQSETQVGQFRTAPLKHGDQAVRFHWSGDTAGQGWGINHEFGGMKLYEAMRKRSPDFFIHSGDTIYADGPILPEVKAEGGRIWKNLVTEEVSKVAETLKEFRGRHAYNLMDANVQKFSAEVPQIWQWDDHEVTNNYSASKDLSADARYTVKDVGILAARGQRAFLEYAPMRYTKQPAEARRIYRKIPYGPLLDVFVLDMRSYRGPNTANLQPFESDATALLGNEQVDWLIAQLLTSSATWKVIAADMPIGLYVGDGKDADGNNKWEAVSNGQDGPALGRELEIARLLRSIKALKNVVWITADVHYCAAHYYDPSNARFNDFAGFWEFVAGPINAGSFGPSKLDQTFGPTAVFQKGPEVQAASPFAGFQFFGEVNIDPQSKALSVDLISLDGVSQFKKVLAPEQA
jgi:alkaline phosphatase D